MPKTFLAFGEVLWDLLPTGAILGGAPFNFAYRANCLGENAIMSSRLGRDELGRQAMDRIQALGMDTSHIQWDDIRPTGTVKVSFDNDNNPDYIIVPNVAYDYADFLDRLGAIAASADCFCFGTLAQRKSKSRRTLVRIIEAARKATKLLDINLRRDCFSLQTITASLEAADILKLNETEAVELAKMLQLSNSSIDTIAENVIDKFHLDCCVVTLAERGVFATLSDGTKVYSPGYSIKLADPLGAGDAFTAGFLHKFLAGEPAAECCRYGNAIGAMVASQSGATAPLNVEDIADFITAEPERIREPAMAKFAVE